MTGNSLHAAHVLRSSYTSFLPRTSASLKKIVVSAGFTLGCELLWIGTTHAMPAESFEVIFVERIILSVVPSQKIAAFCSGARTCA